MSGKSHSIYGWDEKANETLFIFFHGNFFPVRYGIKRIILIQIG
jgi:hypothetical protein